MYVIVTDVEYRMSLAAIRDLSESGCRVVCVTTKPLPLAIGGASRYAEKTYVIDSKQTNYIDQLDAICRSYIVEGVLPVVLPIGKFTLYELARRPLRYGLHLSAAEDVLEAANNKMNVLSVAASLGIRIPASYVQNKDESIGAFALRIAYPCVIKYRDGEALGLKADKRYQIIRRPEDFAVQYERMRALQEAPLVQQYIEGDGWGVSCVFDGSRMTEYLCHRRIREYPVSGGPSTCCISTDGGGLPQAAQKLLRALSFRGVAMVEFKGSREGGFYLMEINPRVWGSFALTRAAGSRFADKWRKAAAALPTLDAASGGVPGAGSDGMSGGVHRTAPSAEPDGVLGNASGGVPDAIYALASDAPLPKASYRTGVKMIYRVNDMAACLSYLKQGRFGKAFGALADILNPFIRDGVFEWRDPKPFWIYIKHLRKA